MNKELPTIVITGASGFLGRHLIDVFKEEFNVLGIARRSRVEVGIPYHQNLQWVQCDVADFDTLLKMKEYVNQIGSIDLLIHLAAYYDFTYKDNPEYERTNVIGTKNILEFAKSISLKRFVFASSLAACNFPANGEKITEKSIPNADYHYARSKKAGEELVKEYSKYFPASVIRFAAIYSDWCEFAPLYKFLTTWLSKKIDSRFLAGKGESAIPYIHVNDVCSLIKKIYKENKNLSSFNVYNASFDGSTSHLNLFELATRYYYGEPVKPFFLPKFLAYPALLLKNILKHLHLTCEQPFERYWMIKYIDLKLDVDSSYTRKALGWHPTPRFHIERRLLFLLEKMKSHPDEWKLKNEAALHRVARRVNYVIYENMSASKEKLIDQISLEIFAEENIEKFARYKKMKSEDYQCYISTVYHLLMATVRSGDRGLMLKYIDDIAIRRFAEGFLPNELCETLGIYKKIICNHLTSIKELKNIHQEIYDYIGLTLQLAQDEIEDLYENLLQKMPVEKIAESPLLPDCTELKKMIRQLSAFYQIAPDNGNKYEDLR